MILSTDKTPAKSTRVLILCTHNSARGQMAEGWMRHYAKEMGTDVEVASTETEQTQVKPEAVMVMQEVGIDLTSHISKTLDDLPDPWAFDVVEMVCDSTNEACPSYLAKTTRLHVSFPDPSGRGLERWREVRDAIGGMSRALVEAITKCETPDESRQLLASVC